MTPNLRHDLSLLALRLMAGAVFVFHGSQKLLGLFGGHGIAGTAGWMESLGIPFPTAAAVLSGGAELLGGVALMTGLFARAASLSLLVNMLVAAFTAHAGFDASSGGMEYPLTLAVIALSIGLAGPGHLSLGGGRVDVPLLRPATA
jgi:putative oxidoreductase